MPDHIRELRRPIVRRVGRLVFTITADGVELRGYGRRKRRFVTWSQIAALSGPELPIAQQAEKESGNVELTLLHAEPQATIAKKKEPPKE